MVTGLSTSEAKRRLRRYGPNVLVEVGKVPNWKKFLGQFRDLMVVILILAAVIAILVNRVEGSGDLDGYVILGIVVLNACIGFYQEYKADKALEALKKMVSPMARVIRNGHEAMVRSEEVVPGDVLVLSAGDKVAADAKVLEAHELRLDESALTGESVPVSKNGDDSALHMGTHVTAGSGLAKVEKTGMSTEFGKIARLTTGTQRDLSPLQVEMKSIGSFVGKVTLGISTVLLLTGILIQGESFIHSLLFSVSVAVAAVPEGLPSTITIALAIGVQRLAKKHAIIKKLASVETLGGTTVICSDKTGTLTRNEMTVKEILVGTGTVLPVSGTGYDPSSGSIVCSSTRPVDLDLLLQVGQVCNESTLDEHQGRYSVLGDPTEGALITLAKKGGMVLSKTIQKIQTFPFDSSRKMMSVVVQHVDRDQKDQLEVWLKGSPDALLERATKILVDGKVREITEKDVSGIRHHYETMAGKALRVLALAVRPLGDDSYDTSDTVEKNVTFVGLVGMIDPPRTEVKAAVNLCHQAGMRTLILTGDYGLTAKAIAEQLDMANERTPVVTGDELEKMSNSKVDTLLKENWRIIFARVSPEHKLLVIDRLKKLGEVVAVTGDGVNDAPAIKRADIGIAMGIAGTDVSKEAATMVLMDDAYGTIVNAVEEGRQIYANLKKFVWFIFSCNIGELVTVFSAILLSIPAPLTAVLILAVDLGTDVLPAIALAMDPLEPDVMKQAPRKPEKRIMDGPFTAHFLFVGLFIGVIVMSNYFGALFRNGWVWGAELSADDPVHLYASTVAFAMLVVMQLVNAFNARSFTYSVFRLTRNWYLWGAVLISILLVLAIVYVPALQVAFHTVPLDLPSWGIILVSSFSILVVEEIRKLMMR